MVDSPWSIRTGSHLIDAGLLLGPRRSNDLIRTWPAGRTDGRTYLCTYVRTYARTHFQIFGFSDFQNMLFLDSKQGLGFERGLEFEKGLGFEKGLEFERGDLNKKLIS